MANIPNWSDIHIHIKHEYRMEQNEYWVLQRGVETERDTGLNKLNAKNNNMRFGCTHFIYL